MDNNFDTLIDQDAGKYGEEWYPVLDVLRSGKSLTHKELIDIYGFSYNILSKIIGEMKPKLYITSRKIGKTIYYRLSSKGRILLLYLDMKRGRRNSMKENKIEKLYELLERAKKEYDQEAEAALRWAIFQLENNC